MDSHGIISGDDATSDEIESTPPNARFRLLPGDEGVPDDENVSAVGTTTPVLLDGDVLINELRLLNMSPNEDGKMVGTPRSGSE